MVQDFTINKSALEDYVEQKFGGESLGAQQQDNYKFSTESSYVKIREPYAINQTVDSLYRKARDNHQYLRQTEHNVVSQNVAKLEIFDELVAVIFQPKLKDLDESNAQEAADYFLDVAEDDILLDPKLGNVGMRPNSGRIEYLDTSDCSSVRIPRNESFGSVTGFNQDRVDFDLLMKAHHLGHVESESGIGFGQVLEERASNRYDRKHRLHP